MNTYLYGKVIDFDKINSNNRIYPKDETIKAIESFNAKDTKLSEVFPIERSVTINLDNVGAICEELIVEDNSVYAKLKVLDTKNGKDLDTLLSDKDGMCMLSLRGTTTPSLLLDSNVMLINDLSIISIDVLPFDGVDPDTICKISKK